MSLYVNWPKRSIDFISALLGLVLFSPIMFILMVPIIISNRGHIFFIQNRPGKNEKRFRVIKLKTMTDKRDTEGNLLPDSDRLTSVGKFIRKTSLDEMPQLINVLKGDMSFVGPRPLLPGYLQLYNDFQKRRHEVKPGITGWAQVNGRNSISWEQKFEYDVWYVDHCSFLLDTKIILMTIKKVFKREGISQEGQVTMEFFKGTNNKSI